MENSSPIDKVEDKNPDLPGNGSSSGQESSEPFPLKIVLAIMKYLSPRERVRVERVSKLWRQASKSLWRDTNKLTILDDRDSVRFGKLILTEKSNAIKFSENATILIYTRDLRIIHSLVSRVGPYIKIFERECLAKSENEGQILSIVAHYCHNIQVLNLWLEVTKYDDFALAKLIYANEELHTLKYVCIYQFYLRPLLLRNWKSMELSHLALFDEDVECLNKVLLLLSCSQALVKYEMSRLFTTHVMQVLSRYNLQVLNMSFLFDPEVAYGVFEMKHLKSLTITLFVNEEFHPGLELDFFEGLSENCRSLERFETDSINCDAITAIHTILTLPKLETLDLRVRDFDDYEFIHLGKLKNFILRNTGGTFNDLGLITMIMNAEHLQVFVIKGGTLGSGIITEIRDVLGECSRAITIGLSDRSRAEKFSQICRNSTIRIRRLDTIREKCHSLEIE